MNTVGSPATCKNGIAVGASQNAAPHTSSYERGPDYLAEFSSRGPTADGRIKPDCVAPGIRIKSARAVPDSVGECDNSSGLMFAAGTSMATPIVSGSAALVRQYFEEGWHVDGRRKLSAGFNPRASLVKAVLLNGGSPLLGVEERASGKVLASDPYDEHQGFGRINLLDSLPIHGENDLSAKFVNARSIGNGGRHEIEVVIDGSGTCAYPLSATLVWTDPSVGAFCKECTYRS